MSFLLSLITVISSYQVVWENINIDVKLNDDIMAYVDMPQARLYIDGILFNVDATYTYDGVNRTFLSTISTSYVKTYKLDYEVYYELYDIKDQMTIYFHVIDDVAPVFLYVPTYEIDVGDKIPDLEALISYKDNYDETEALVLEIDDYAVDTSRVGTYPITYYLYDKSLNKAEKTTYISVVDKIAPTISLKKPLSIEYGTKSIDIDEYFKIDDNVDNQVNVSINDNQVDYLVLGSYPVWVTVTDQSNQEGVYSYMVDIVDTLEPVIMLSSPTPISVHDINRLDYLDEYILSVYDNYDFIKIEDVTIQHDIDIDVVGKYTLYFSVHDQSNNLCEEKLSIEVVDDKIPEIKLIKPMIIDVFSQEPFLITYFDITDNYYNYGELEIDIDVDLNLNVIDQYQIIVKVEDPSKNIAYYYDYVSIVDKTPVEISQTNEIIITDFSAVNYTSYFSFSDNYDEQITNFVFDDSSVDYKTKGEYKLDVYAIDSSNNSSLLTTYIYIIDIVPPTLEIVMQQMIIPVGNETLDLTAYIVSVNDNYDDLNIDDVTIDGEIDYAQVGVYTISYCVKDSSLNETCIDLDIIVDDLEQPIVEMEDIKIEKNGTINYLENISVKDISKYQIYFDENYIDTSIEGIQYLTYVIQDERGNYTTYVRKIEILPNNKSKNLVAYIPLIIVIISSVSSIGFVYFKYKK